ncbi:MAG: Gfo/Idh/MocA family oxidoreductase [Gemmatimonadetes bacterium]|nr:Gfo/Idh/MocA family oxidoreductase [Gemmatimonadota bacterium]
MNAEREFRIGVLGTGAIAQVVHLPILSELTGVRVQAVCDADRSKATALASRFGIPRVLRTDEEVLESKDIEAVIICTPSHLHEAEAIAALEAGKHVLVEKPLALSAEGALRVLKAAERTGTTLMVAMNNRYRPDCTALKPFLSGRELGHVFLMKGAWLNRKVRVARPTWRHRRETAGGGALMDLGVQVLDLCLWLLDFPRIRRVVAHVHAGESMEVEDSAAVLLATETGTTISVALSWSLVAERDRHYLRMLGTRGSASIAPLGVYKEVEHGLLDLTPQLPPGRENVYTASYRQELEAFVRAARGQEKPAPPHEQVELMKLIALAYQSAEQGREIQT